ncbi:MAG: hypothetical protein AB7T63_06160 [Planctomycetota bacterium]
MNDRTTERIDAWLRAEAQRDGAGDLGAQVLAQLPARGRGWSPWALGAAGLVLAARAVAAFLLFFTR